MSTKRVSVANTVFGKPATALDKLVGRVNSEGETVEPYNSNTAEPQDSSAVKLYNNNTVEPQNLDNVKIGSEKTTFYLRPDQLDKLDELTLAYKKRTRKRINRNDIVRQLIDLCDLEMLVENWERQ